MRAWMLSCAMIVVGACGQDDRPANWEYVYEAIIRPNCTTVSCHTGANATAGVNLETRFAAYVIFTGRSCEDTTRPPEAATQNFVVPGDPVSSRLYHLLLGKEVTRSMPPDRLLPLQDVELVERWILEGALCN